MRAGCRGGCRWSWSLVSSWPFFLDTRQRVLGQLRVRAPAEDDNVANHDAGGGVLSPSSQRAAEEKVEGRSRRKSGTNLGPSRRCGRWRDDFQELGSMVNNRSLRIHPDELFEPFSAKSRSTETAKRQGYAILSFQARNRCLQLPLCAPNAAPPDADADAFLINAAFLHGPHCRTLSNCSVLIYAKAAGFKVRLPKSDNHVPCAVEGTLHRSGAHFVGC